MSCSIGHIGTFQMATNPLLLVSLPNVERGTTKVITCDSDTAAVASADKALSDVGWQSCKQSSRALLTAFVLVAAAVQTNMPGAWIFDVTAASLAVSIAGDAAATDCTGFGSCCGKSHE